MSMLAPRDSNGSQSGSTMPPEWMSVTATQSIEWLTTSQANRPHYAGTQPELRRASGFLTLFNLIQKQSTHRMTTELPVLPIRFEDLESPRNAIEASILSPREPEIQQEQCLIRPTARGDLNPEETPVTVTAIATATATATAIATATVTGPVKAAQEETPSPEGAALAVADHARDQNAFL